MTNLSRVTAKIFGETATATGADPEIGQFGSALAGTYVGTNDVATIQSLSAWSNGFIDSVTPSTQFPPLPEMTGFGKVLSYQTAYTMQKGVPEWDASTVYYTGDFCKGVGEGKLYVSKVDSNTNHAVTDGNYWEEFSSGASRNIGEIVASTIPLTDAGLHLLDGALLTYGSYQAFIDYIADLYDSGDYPDLFDTEANWQSAVTQYGVCGKFVYDSVSNTVRLPKITGIIEGTTDLTALGDLIEAGLPNITGKFANKDIPDSTNGQYTYFTDVSGAFAIDKTGLSSFNGSGSGSNGNSLKMDASLSNSIYGNSNTVQPQSIKVLYYVVIATSTKTQIQVDIDEIATDLNGKADVDLTNINATGQITIAHNAMPSFTYESVTIGASGSSYTAPADGYFSFHAQATSTSAFISMYVSASNNDVLYGYKQNCNVNAQHLYATMPVYKGQTVTHAYGNVSNNYGYFIYAVGSESEA